MNTTPVIQIKNMGKINNLPYNTYYLYINKDIVAKSERFAGKTMVEQAVMFCREFKVNYYFDASNNRIFVGPEENPQYEIDNLNRTLNKLLYTAKNLEYIDASTIFNYARELKSSKLLLEEIIMVLELAGEDKWGG